MNHYTVVVMSPIGRGANLRDDSIVEIVEALTPSHAAAKVRRMLAERDDQDPDCYEIIAVFESALQDEFDPECEPEGKDLEELDRELEAEKKEDAEIRQELGLGEEA
jgi:hypothetical protein